MPLETPLTLIIVLALISVNLLLITLTLSVLLVLDTVPPLIVKPSIVTLLLAITTLVLSVTSPCALKLIPLSITTGLLYYQDRQEFQYYLQTQQSLHQYY